MARENADVMQFAGGEMSASALARVDQARLRIGCEVQENLFAHVIGKGLFRPGTTWIANTVSNAKTRPIPFVKSTTDTAVLDLSSATLRVRISDALVTRSSVTSTVVNSAFSTASATITVTIASPGVVTWTSHGRSANDPVSFGTDGDLPTGLVEGTVYYVVGASITANTFQVSATSGGAAINTSGSQSGTHTGYYGWGVSASAGATATIVGGVLTLAATARGSTTTARQAVATSSANTEHALRIVITSGDVLLRIGSTSGGSEYIADTTLGRGTHSIAFTPTASPYHIQFSTRSDVVCQVDQCAIESAGTMALDAPWSEADLPLIRYAQSLDVVFLACASWAPRKIERRHSGRSWSVVYYDTNDGPFITSDTGGVTLTPSAVQGAGTLTASSPVFAATDVGRLVKALPSGYSAAFSVSSADKYSGSTRVYGVAADTDFTYTVAGTFVGTWQLQRTYDGEDTGFIDVATHTGSGTTAAAPYNASTIPGQPYNNIAHWYRLGFKAGNYTSGTADFSITYPGGGRTGIYRVTSFSSSTSVGVQVLDHSGSLSATAEWSLGAWSSSTQWPSAVSFFDGRLWWGGDDQFWASESDAYYSFNLDDDGAAGSIQRVVATGGQNIIRWMLPLQRMILGTSSAEVSVRSSSFDEPLSPVNITLKECATQGVAAVTPVKLDNRGIYVHRDGRRLFELAYDADGADYRATSLMTLNDGIGGDGISALAVQRSPETYVWAVRADGQCLVLLHDVKERVQAWTRFVGAASAAGEAVIEDVCVLPSATYDRVYLYVRRTVNGSTVRFIEKLALHSEATGGTTTILSDCSVTAAGPITTFTGLTHLVGETVVVWGTTGGVTGPIGTTYTVNGSGEITLPSSSTNVTVGLAYSWRYKSAKLAYAAKGGTPLLQPKRVSTIGVLAENIHPNALTYGSDFTTMYATPRIENGQVVGSTVQATYDEAMFPFGGGWDTDSRVCLKGSSPYPVTLNALVIGIETNEV